MTLIKRSFGNSLKLKRKFCEAYSIKILYDKIKRYATDSIQNDNDFQMLAEKSPKQNRFSVGRTIHVMIITLGTITKTAVAKPFDVSYQSQDLFMQYYLNSGELDNNETELNLEKVNWTVLDLKKIMEILPRLESLTVVNSNISTVIPPEGQNDVKRLVFKNLLLTNVTFLKSFPNLETIHLEGNRLRSITTDTFPSNIKDVFLKNNSWSCFEDVTWTLELLNRSINTDVDTLTCADKRFQGKLLVTVAKFAKEMKQNELCMKTCVCNLIKVINTDIISTVSEPIISVNCSGKHLKEMPYNLPKYTRMLYLENNEIGSLSPLKNNPLYKHVWDLYLDNNQITSIMVLEGSYWLSHFRTLSLRGNKLRKLPCYALDNALLKNPNTPIVRIYLGENPWRCDCAYTPVFQELVLRKYSAQVRDIQDVKCPHIKGEEERKLPIVELTRSSICRLPMEYSLQEGLDLLNAVLASLIIFILGKLAYDYYHFKKSGKLPWIIMKMP